MVEDGPGSYVDDLLDYLLGIWDACDAGPQHSYQILIPLHHHGRTASVEVLAYQLPARIPIFQDEPH